MDWTDEEIERLRALWAEGLSTAEIGRRMNTTKSSVVGKAHRLNLPSRPSPIRRGKQELYGPPRPPTPRRATGPTLQPLASANGIILEGPRVPGTGDVDVFADDVRTPSTPAPVRTTPRALRIGGRNTCHWPIGEPRTKSFRFCDAEASGGKPYCREHAQIAFVKVRDRREDAA